MNSILYPIFYIDPPRILQANVTSIPDSGSDPLQIVSESGSRAAYGIHYIDTTGDYMGLYIGEIGEEELKCIIGGGTTSYINVVIPVHSRVSIRSMTPEEITNGSITITFLGQGWNGLG